MTIPPDEGLDLTAVILKLTGYRSGRSIIHQKQETPFEMCGKKVDANADACVMERGDFKIFVDCRGEQC